MPPLDPEQLEAEISEDEIPAKEPKPVAKEGDMAVDEPDGEEEEEDGDEEEYVVEKILSHRKKGRTILYLVKWLGYDNEDDQTEEPEENLKNAQELVDAYWESMGGRPDDAKGKKRKHSTSAEETTKNGRGRKRAKDLDEQDELPAKKKLRKMPEGSWENHIACIDTLEEKLDPKSGNSQKLAYVAWNDDFDPRRTVHPLEVLRKKAPQKLIEYFIQHLVFKSADEAEPNGDNAE